LTMALAIVFMVALIFSFIYEVSNSPNSIFSGIIAAGTWMFFGVLFFVAYATSGERTFGFLFNGIGIIYIIRILVELLQARSWGRRLTGDEN